jgi:cyclophilin family peptidyl-prolyl cis-trans isomerase
VLPRIKTLGASLLLGALIASISMAQAAEDPAAQYTAVRAQWDQTYNRLGDLEKQFRAAPPEKQEEIRQQYATLVDQLDDLLPKLSQTASEAYRAAPNADPDLTLLLVGLSANALRNDRYDEAAGLAQMLIDNDCPEKAVYGVAGSAAYCRDDFARAEEYLNIAREANLLEQTGQIYATDVPQAKKLWAVEKQLREAEAAADDLPRVLMKTSKGDLVLELFENEAPQTVGNFISLVEKGYYNGLTFHRVLPGFMAQGGCPDGSGGGGPGYQIYCECDKPGHRKHFRGVLSMAHAGKNTGGSQFFLTFRRTSHLDGGHTVFGRVVEGLEVLEELQRIDPQRSAGIEPDRIVEAKVIRKRDHAYQPTRVR